MRLRRAPAGVVVASLLLASPIALPAAPAGDQAPGAATAPAQVPGQAGDQTPVFRAGTQTIAVYATAIDRYGEMVRDLPREAFHVEVDGHRQPLTVFQNGRQPITAALLIDTSASMTPNLDLARAAAEQFIIRLLPGDKARVGVFNSRLQLSPAFTGDRDALLQTIDDDLQIGNPTCLWDAVNETMTALEPLDGRRIIMLLTDGMDTVSTTRMTDVLARARGEDLMVYVVQFRSTPQANLAEVPLSPSATRLFAGDPRLRNPPPTQALRDLTRQTGGGHFLLSQNDDVNATFTQVLEELHDQYVLGFTPPELDGRIHDVTVTVDRPNVTIRARRNYLAPRPGTGALP